jgi:hypothetical protein
VNPVNGENGLFAELRYWMGPSDTPAAFAAIGPTNNPTASNPRIFDSMSLPLVVGTRRIRRVLLNRQASAEPTAGTRSLVNDLRDPSPSGGTVRHRIM